MCAFSCFVHKEYPGVPVALLLTKSSITGSMMTLTSPLEFSPDGYTYAPSCCTPTSLKSQPLTGSEYSSLSYSSEVDTVSIQTSKLGSSEMQSSGASSSDLTSIDRSGVTCSSQDTAVPTMPKFTLLRRHSYDSMAYIYQSDYLSL